MAIGLFLVGKVIKPHGVKGRIKIRYYGEDLRQFSRYREIVLRDRRGHSKTHDILEIVLQPPLLILKLKGIEKIEDAETLVGHEILIRRDLLPDLKEDEYYWMDLLGMAVESEGGKRIGTIKEIFPTGANDVYVVEGRRGEVFLPATEEVIKRIDLGRRIVTAHWMEGLWEKEDEV